MLTGDKIKLLRMKKGFSQEQLAYYAGVSIKTIQRVENNHSISVESLRGIAAAFDKDIEEFFGHFQHLGLIKEEFTKQARGINDSIFFRNQQIIDTMMACANLRQEDVVMDLGCGTGIMTAAIGNQVSKLLAVDVTEKMIRETMNRCEEMGFHHVHYIKCNSEKIPIPSSSIDKVIVRLGFHHFYNTTKVMKEIVRVLKKDGLLVIGDVITSTNPKVSELHNAIEKLRDPSHIKLCSKKDFLDMAEAHHLHVQYTNNHTVKRSYDEWLDITKSPERYEPLNVILKTLIQEGVDAGMHLERQGDKIHFEHKWLFLVLKK